MKKYWILIVTVIALIFLGIFIFNSSAKNAIYSSNYSLGKTINGKFSTIGNFFADLKSIRNIIGQNKDLSDQVNQLETEIAKYKELQQENIALKEELKFFNAQKNKDLLGAQIISKSVSPFLEYYLIDKGKADGVIVNQAVLSQGYLVGKISQVYENYSQIELITDSKIILPVIAQESRATGLLKANLEGLYIDNIPIDSELREGEMVLTSNLDQSLPSDIPVGKIGKVVSYSSQIFKTAKINSPLNFSSLKFVFIIRN